MARGPAGQRFAAVATRLGLAVLVASCCVAVAETGLAARLAGQAVAREAVARVGAAAAAVSATPEATPLHTRLMPLAAEPDVVAVRAVRADGTVLATVAHPSGPGPTRPREVAALGADALAAVRQVTAGAAPAQLRAGSVVTALRVGGEPAALVVTLDPAPGDRRSRQLWQALAVALALGALAAVPLVFLTGGRRLARRHAQAVSAAATDDLTGLGSRRAFRRDLAAQVDLARRRGHPLTLALIDVNGLELVNSTIGRRRGDALIAALGGALGRAVTGGRGWRSYRVGGDAFAIVMPATTMDEAFDLTDRLRGTLAADAAPLTANVGLSGLDAQRCPDVETLLIAADSALFEARALGGNRVVGSSEEGTGLRWVATPGRAPAAPGGRPGLAGPGLAGPG